MLSVSELPVSLLSLLGNLGALYLFSTVKSRLMRREMPRKERMPLEWRKLQ